MKLRSITEEIGKADETVRSMVLQMAGTAKSFLGNRRAALELFDRRHPEDELEIPDPAPLSLLCSEDDVAALVRAARSSRAVGLARIGSIR